MEVMYNKDMENIMLSHLGIFFHSYHFLKQLHIRTPYKGLKQPMEIYKVLLLVTSKMKLVQAI